MKSRWLYTIDITGGISISVDVDINDTVPPLPRIGLSFISQDETNVKSTPVSWFGRGPHENYPDRKASSTIGYYQQDAKALHTDYIFPSENGLRCDCNSLEINQLVINGNFHFSISQYGQQKLAKALHTHELKADKYFHVHIDHQHMGIGGDDSWSPSVHSEFLLTEKHYNYKLLLKTS